MLFVICLAFNVVAFAQSSRDSVTKKHFLLYDSVVKTKNTVVTLKPDYYTKQLGFFCRQELQIEKAAKFPIRFRLGNLNYVNALEQKPGYSIIRP